MMAELERLPLGSISWRAFTVPEANQGQEFYC
jgi:hypothetical protein